MCICTSKWRINKTFHLLMFSDALGGCRAACFSLNLNEKQILFARHVAAANALARNNATASLLPSTNAEPLHYHPLFLTTPRRLSLFAGATFKLWSTATAVAAIILLQSPSITQLHGRPRAGPLHEYLILPAHGATQQDLHDPSWRHNNCVNPSTGSMHGRQDHNAAW